MFCSNCGTEVNDGSKFCPVCGKAMQVPQAPSEQSDINVAGREPSQEVVTDSAVSGTQGSFAETSGYQTENAMNSEVSGGAETPEGVRPEVTDAARNIGEGSYSAGQGYENAADNDALGIDGAASVNTETSDMQSQSLGYETSASSVSQGNLTDQYVKRLNEQKQAQYGTYNNGGAGTQQFGTEPGRNTGFNGTYNGGQQTQNGNYGQFSNGQQYQAPQPKDSLVTAGCVLAIVALVLAFFQLLGILGGVFGIFAGIAEEGFAGFVFSVGTLLIKVIKLAGFLISALSMYLVWKKWEDGKAEPLMVGTMAGGVLIVLTVILRGIFVGFFNGVVFGYTYEKAFSGAFLGTVFAIVMMAVTYVFVSGKHINPFAGLQGNIGEGLKRNFKTVSEMAVEAKNEFQAGNGNHSNVNYGGNNAGTYNNAGGTYNGVNQSAASGNMNSVNVQPGNFVNGPLPTDRNIVTYILLGLVTCGIYDLYVLHCMIKDVNITCAGDGKTTSGIFEYIVFGILTCGIYDYYWLYTFANRIGDNAPRYGMNFQENGTTILLWWIFGAFLCGVGPFIAMYLLIKNTNALNAAYNQINFGGNQNGQIG